MLLQVVWRCSCENVSCAHCLWSMRSQRYCWTSVVVSSALLRSCKVLRGCVISIVIVSRHCPPLLRLLLCTAACSWVALHFLQSWSFYCPFVNFVAFVCYAHGSLGQCFDDEFVFCVTLSLSLAMLLFSVCLLVVIAFCFFQLKFDTYWDHPNNSISKNVLLLCWVFTFRSLLPANELD